MKKCAEGKKKGHTSMGKSKRVVISRVQRSSPRTLISNKNSSFQKEVDLTVQEQGRDTIGI